MQAILRTNDPVLISYVRNLLMDAGIESVEFDSHIANMEGSVGAIPADSWCTMPTSTEHWRLSPM